MALFEFGRLNSIFGSTFSHKGSGQWSTIIPLFLFAVVTCRLSDEVRQESVYTVRFRDDIVRLVRRE